MHPQIWNIYEHPTLHARESTEVSALQSRKLFIKSILYFMNPKKVCWLGMLTTWKLILIYLEQYLEKKSTNPSVSA